MNNEIEILKQELKKSVIGQDEMIENILIAILSNGHVLIEGVPGLAKTTTVNALSKALGIDFKRIQFTPDLLPSDIIGAQIYNPKDHTFQIKKGPIFTNLLLADEINRAPAKVQSALLEVMQERQVTIGDDSFVLDKPFFVMATQNPIEQEGVYALPEAQLDRFMMKILVSYNTHNDELEIMRKASTNSFQSIENVLNNQDISNIQNSINTIHIDEELEHYIVNIIGATRKDNDNIMHGVSPRASIDLYKASKAKALIEGRDYVSPTDIGSMAFPVLRHRIVPSYEARAKGINNDNIISSILEEIPIP